MNQFTVRPKISNFHTNRSKSIDKRDEKCTRCGGSHLLRKNAQYGIGSAEILTK